MYYSFSLSVIQQVFTVAFLQPYMHKFDVYTYINFIYKIFLFRIDIL